MELQPFGTSVSQRLTKLFSPLYLYPWVAPLASALVRGLALRTGLGFGPGSDRSDGAVWQEDDLTDFFSLKLYPIYLSKDDFTPF